MGDHTETVEVEYDPEVVSYGQLLDMFWDNHDYTDNSSRLLGSRWDNTCSI